MSGHHDLFWSGFLPEFHNCYPGWEAKVRDRTRHWISCPSSKPGLLYVASWSKLPIHHLKAECYIDSKSKERNKEVFDVLYERRGQLEQTIGDRLKWKRKCDKRKSTIELWYPSSPIEIVEEERWPEARQWLLGALGRLRDAFDPTLNRLIV